MPPHRGPTYNPYSGRVYGSWTRSLLLLVPRSGSGPRLPVNRACIFPAWPAGEESCPGALRIASLLLRGIVRSRRPSSWDPSTASRRATCRRSSHPWGGIACEVGRRVRAYLCPREWRKRLPLCPRERRASWRSRLSTRGRSCDANLRGRRSFQRVLRVGEGAP